MKKFMLVKENVEKWAVGVVTARFMKFLIMKEN